MLGLMRPRRHTVLALALTVLGGCRTGSNYTSVSGPRYAGGPPETRTAVPVDLHSLRIVSFNIEYARHVDGATKVIASDPELRGADVILLQEMDEIGTRHLADAFGMHYVYYPATLSLKTGRDFGNAVLSRWPIVDDAKILLPHVGVVGHLQRTATAATIRVGGSPSDPGSTGTLVRVYSTHLGTLLNATASGQRDQLRTVLADAEGHPHVVIGGDMNSHGVGRVAQRMGYAWPTERGPRTTRFGRWDHIFFKGLTSPDNGGAGTVLDVRHTSDHRAVWAVARLQ
jgi:endonuclease/exonuclease/phosphatase family metal-dependent hydrolase